MSAGSNSELERMRGTVEELSLKKQLPLRMQTDKPTLKYDTSMTKPLQLFNHNNLAARRDSRGQAVSAPGTPTKSQSTNGNDKASESSGISPNPKKVRNNGSTHSSPAKGVSNPYSRPLSAKEVIEDVQQSHRNRRLQQHHNSTIMPAPSIPASMAMPPFNGYPDFDMSSLQLNSFLRPQSGTWREAGVPRSRNQRAVQGGGEGGYGGGEMPVRTRAGYHHDDHPSSARMAASRGVPSESAKAALHQAFALAATTGVCHHHTALGGMNTRPRNTPVKEATANLQRKPPQATVRNPNYSPNKPYQDVDANEVDQDQTPVMTDQRPFNTKQPLVKIPTSRPYNAPTYLSTGSQTPASMEGTQTKLSPSKKDPFGHASPGGGLGVIAGVEDSGLPLHNLTPSALLSTKMGTLRKMPVTNTLTGTLYYKKSFRDATARQAAEQKQQLKLQQAVNEQRPRADGAPSKHKQVIPEAPKELKSKEKILQTQMQSLNSMPEDDDDGEESLEEEDYLSTPSGERMPGDGEASIEELDEYDDGIDDLYEDGGDDGAESDDYTISSSLSHASCSTVHLQSATSRPSTTQSTRAAGAGEERTRSFIRPVTSSGETVTQPALRPSLFASIPPSINFVVEGEKVEQLPWEIRKFLKWRMSPITPNIVKSALNRSNFRITRKNHDWIGCFGKHMKASAFKCLREYQKLNHFPGSFQLGRKDRLWRNLSKMQVSFGKKEFAFFPHTYVLPQDLKLLKRTWEDSTSRQKWIIKPPASARGIGIKVIHKWTQIPRKRPVIVQKYLSRPLLINDSKFDMRVYVYVSSYDPLRVYVFEDGLARFASCKYSSAMKNLNNKFMHLTNYSINKRNSDYQSNTDDTVCQGHKWSLKSLWNYLKKQGVNTQVVWDSIKDIVVKTVISSEAAVNSMTKSNVKSRYVVHELFGFDILLDDQFRPWILEVNISPSLHSNSQLDINVKGQMIRDMLNLAGYRVPDKNDVVHGSHSSTSVPDQGRNSMPSNDYCMDKRLFTSQLAPDERAKHAYFCHKYQDEQVLQTILDTLTPDDVRILTESIDEDSRKGGFIRVFPTPSTKRYLRYFEQPRYYNLLLDQWVTRYNKMEQRGISLLQALCEEGIHLESPADGHCHQWYPPNCTAMMSARDKASQMKKDGAGQGKCVGGGEGGEDEECGEHCITLPVPLPSDRIVFIRLPSHFRPLPPFTSPGPSKVTSYPPASPRPAPCVQSPRACDGLPSVSPQAPPCPHASRHAPHVRFIYNPSVLRDRDRR